MRVLILTLLLAASYSASAKKPATSARAPYERITLFNGNVQLDVPTILQKDREYYHYWDKCSEGGYTVTFAAKCTRKAGMNMQLNIHDHIQSPEHAHDIYNPREHCVRNTRLLQDTTFLIGNKEYTVISTLATRDRARRDGTRTNNYNLSYYIIADGRMLEFQYYYWAEDNKGLEYWRDLSYRIANSIKWYSPGWVTAKR